MRNPLRRYYGRGDLHFVTFSCYRRRPFLGTRRARDHFVKILNQVRSRYGFQLVGYVVMPEHVHLLLSGAQEGQSFKNPAGAKANRFPQTAREAKEVCRGPIVVAIW